LIMLGLLLFLLRVQTAASFEFVQILDIRDRSELCILIKVEQEIRTILVNKLVETKVATTSPHNQTAPFIILQYPIINQHILSDLLNLLPLLLVLPFLLFLLQYLQPFFFFLQFLLFLSLYICPFGL